MNDSLRTSADPSLLLVKMENESYIREIAVIVAFFLSLGIKLLLALFFLMLKGDN